MFAGPEEPSDICKKDIIVVHKFDIMNQEEECVVSIVAWDLILMLIWELLIQLVRCFVYLQNKCPHKVLQCH